MTTTKQQYTPLPRSADFMQAPLSFIDASYPGARIWLKPANLAALTAAWPILVVDDNATFIDLAQRQLQRWGNLTVIGVTSSAEAIQVCQEQPVSLIISDIMRPVISGFDMIRILHADERTQHIPCVVVSSCGSLPSMIEQAHELGIENVYAKPFDYARLGPVIRQLLIP